MYKRHFEAIAKICYEDKVELGTIKKLCKFFKTQNTLFMENRFIEKAYNKEE